MKLRRSVLVLIASIFLSSCIFINDDEATLVVSNYSESESLKITEVYVMEQDSSGYSKIWTGTIAADNSEFISLKPGKYSVLITVINKANVLPLQYSYETGYNIYRTIETGKSAKVIFDGDGIYFE